MPSSAPAEESADAATTTGSAAAGRPGLPDRALALLLVIGGAVGLIAAFVLTVEKIRLIEDPSYVPSCSLNPILSCGSVMSTQQAELFGFPNSLLGIVGFTAVLTAGLALLSGLRPPTWFWAGLQLGVLAGTVLVHWLVFQSLYRIEALCPYCMAVWAVTIPIAWYVTLRNLRAAATRAGASTVRLSRALDRWHSSLLMMWFVTVLALIAERFWSYWSTLL